MVNRHLTESVALAVAMGSFSGELRVAGSWTIADEDIHAVNTEQDPDRVVPGEGVVGAALTDGTLHATLPPVSWTAIHLATHQRSARTA